MTDGISKRLQLRVRDPADCRIWLPGNRDRSPRHRICVGLVAAAFLSAIGGLAVAAEPPRFGELPAILAHPDQAAMVRGDIGLDQIIAHGRLLFSARFNTLDGQGRPGSTGTGAMRVASEPAFTRVSGPTSVSCAGCHIIPRVGGAGDFVANAFTSAEAMDPVALFAAPEFGNERNTLGLHGSGPIEMLAREMTAELIAIRNQAREKALQRVAQGEDPLAAEESRDLVAKGIRFGTIKVRGDGKVDPTGIAGVDWDLIIKPFGQKGTAVSIRELSNRALNNHHGMQSVERFGEGVDADGDGVVDEINLGDLTALALYQAAFATPGQALPAHPEAARAVEAGTELFSKIGCSECHVPQMELNDRYFREPNPFNPPGTAAPDDVGGSISFDMTQQGEKPRLERNAAEGAIVRAFTDLKRHDLNDADYHFFANELLPEGTRLGYATADDFYNVRGAIERSTRDFITRKLWDVGNSDPYGHRGDLTMMTEAIYFHGGEARESRDAFFALPEAERNAVIEFLRSLRLLEPGSALVTDPRKE